MYNISEETKRLGKGEAPELQLLKRLCTVPLSLVPRADRAF